jgi:hypothetical protein
VSGCAFLLVPIALFLVEQELLYVSVELAVAYAEVRPMLLIDGKLRMPGFQ